MIGKHMSSKLYDIEHCVLLDANIGVNVDIEKEKLQNQMKTQFSDKLLQLACNRQIAASRHNIFKELNFQRL